MSAPATLHCPAASIVIGFNDAVHLGAGWHPAQEGPGGVQCRWTSPRAEFRLPGFAVPGSVSVLVYGGGERIGYGLSLYHGEALIVHKPDALEGDGWRMVDFVLENAMVPDSAGSDSSFFLCTERMNADDTLSAAWFVPHAALGNGDYRTLGALVGAVRCFALRETPSMNES